MTGWESLAADSNLWRHIAFEGTKAFEAEYLALDRKCKAKIFGSTDLTPYGVPCPLYGCLC